MIASENFRRPFRVPTTIDWAQRKNATIGEFLLLEK
jgi:hypothetical protein